MGIGRTFRHADILEQRALRRSRFDEDEEMIEYQRYNLRMRCRAELPRRRCGRSPGAGYQCAATDLTETPAGQLQST